MRRLSDFNRGSFVFPASPDDGFWSCFPRKWQTNETQTNNAEMLADGLCRFVVYVFFFEERCANGPSIAVCTKSNKSFSGCSAQVIVASSSDGFRIIIFVPQTQTSKCTSPGRAKPTYKTGSPSKNAAACFRDDDEILCWL